MFVIQKQDGSYFHPLNFIATKEQAVKFDTDKQAQAQIEFFHKHGHFGDCTAVYVGGEIANRLNEDFYVLRQSELDSVVEYDYENSSNGEHFFTCKLVSPDNWNEIYKEWSASIILPRYERNPSEFMWHECPFQNTPDETMEHTKLIVEDFETIMENIALKKENAQASTHPSYKVADKSKPKDFDFEEPMSDLLKNFCEYHGLLFESADEIVTSDASQQAWLDHYCTLWDACQCH